MTLASVLVINDIASFLVAIALTALVAGALGYLVRGRAAGLVTCLLVAIVILTIAHFMELYP